MTIAHAPLNLSDDSTLYSVNMPRTYQKKTNYRKKSDSDILRMSQAATGTRLEEETTLPPNSTLDVVNPPKYT